ncbi:MAG: type II toxin-antitoxin system VapC family toxin [Chloroflexi bacterium]|nr:type II toxin-antitoxin system VapC family toxin [Chloroflexota bacterium]MBI2980097.1 type II toxin-antitoxin system VapC family toxin [Chloroflexota bacterium]
MNFERVCVDASLAVTWLLRIQQDEYADALRRQWLADGVEMIGPPMFHAEVTSVLREEVFFKRLSQEEGEEAFSLYSSIPIRIVDGIMVYRLAWELAKEFNLPVCYDMQYLAVAELEDCDFWTLDRKLVKALRLKGNKRVKWVGEHKDKKSV